MTATTPLRGIYGRWTVTGPFSKTRSGHKTVRCQCTCGTVKYVLLASLRDGTSRSCGCLRTELNGKRPRQRQGTPVHGMRYHPLYTTWNGMMCRCYDPKDTNYPNWGGRGIRVYKPWHDVRAFISWIDANLGPRPKGHTLDRFPDNNGNYQPGNVRWADPKGQYENSRHFRAADGKFTRTEEQT